MSWLGKLLVGRGGATPGVSAKEAEALLRQGALLLDVREAGEWSAAHVAGARHLPLGQLGGGIATLPRDRQVVVMCQSGMRSARATSQLTKAGVEAINLRGGLHAWTAAGLPVKAGKA